jgi:hypothetical protein
MSLKLMVGAYPLSNTITSPTFLWLLIDVVGKLSNIPTDITMAKPGYWLLTPTHKILHCFFCTNTANTFLVPLQVHWSLRLVQKIKTLPFKQDCEKIVLDVRC